MIRSFIVFSDGLSRIGGIVATLLLVAAMVVISEMIFLRYVFRAPTYWETDFVVFSATAAIFIGAPYVLLRKGHVGVDVIEALLGDRARRRLRLVGSVFGLGVWRSIRRRRRESAAKTTDAAAEPTGMTTDAAAEAPRTADAGPAASADPDAGPAASARSEKDEPTDAHRD